jgi:hypothetical protein
MILQALDPVKYRPLLEQCGQYFADTQCENGQWTYTGPFQPAGPIAPVDEKKKDEGTRTTIQIKRRPPAPNGQQIPKAGDNSNSQYAALGIRACHEAGVVLPEETLKRAKAWWENTQLVDGSWSYSHYEPPPKGPKPPPERGYGSMTCGGIGALAIIKSILKEDISKDGHLRRAFDWLTTNFTVQDNPNIAGPRVLPGGKRMVQWYFYYLYGLERACDLNTKEHLGDHYWYPEGAKELLKIQNADGSWKEPGTESDIWATCFAILFLKRATKPLIKTGEGPAK